jgi:hypothetical protein
VKEPRRLLNDADTDSSPFERSLLAAGRARREPDRARERIWSSVAVGLAGTGASAAGGAIAATRAKNVALSLAKLKLLVAGALLVMVTGVVGVTISRDDPAAAAHAAALPGPAATEPKPELVPEVLPTPAPELETQLAVIANTEGTVTTAARKSNGGAANVEASPMATQAPVEGDRSPAVSRSTLREEVALLEKARAALGRGDTVTARATLDDARVRFPNSQLAEERDALDVRVASVSGERAHAESLARAFAEDYPNSPLRAGVESIGRAPQNR